ncbi:putative protein OS=Streptomyces griseomycini OX=66895 GN=FHS37_007007 PE=4 SV=1 [Streptomyces griseomycini]|uniref:Uncharacterized protein n=1 Tax=Streptomyces griseomycini TaxID=66895 RepID=A0A7W7VAF9_9ACTN|nr:hypothetical protein [Streptomyces griseomycini]GGR47924.1 hypothetical protein GCM10015536_62090 [Streptomyces griseomycini]
MSGRADSDTPPDTHAEDPEGLEGPEDPEDTGEADDAEGDARRAR